MEWLWALLAGIAVSFINMFAGGGSLISLPLLLFMGLPAPVANGTNKVGLLFGSFTGMANYQRKKILHWKELFLILPSSLLGGITGSLFAMDISDRIFRIILSIVMIAVLLIILLRPQRWIKSRNKVGGIKQKILMIILFFAIGFYGGFIQAGMGYLVILALSFMNDMDLLKISAYKATIGFVIVLFSLVLFIIQRKVNWPIAAALAAGNALGGWIGSQLAIDKGDKIIRPILAVAVVAMAVKLLLDQSI